MKLSLNANHLKLIAILAMTADHAADLFYPGYPAHPVPFVLHLLGRLTAPIMWFFVCEGFYHTRNVKNYMLRMLFFSVISHFAYCFAFGNPFLPFTNGVFNQTSVIWPLFWAIVGLWLLHKTALKEWQKALLIILIDLITFPSNWSCIAVMAVLSMYGNRGDLKKQMGNVLFWTGLYALISFFFVDRVYACIQIGVILVYPVLKLYNGEKGKAEWMKPFFYLYYPGHLFVIGVLRLMLYGDIPLLF